MNIDGKTRTLGVIGNPIEHTVSPVIHNNLANITGDNFCYLPFKVEESNVKAAIEGAYALGILGLNVTVPHKSAVIPYLKDIDPLAKRIGAVNTLVSCDGGYKGYNTDMPGLLRAMRSDGIEVKDKEVIVLGAGGVARAVAILLSDSGAKHIYILNRTISKAKAIADEIIKDKGEIVTAMELSDYSKLSGNDYICIQATNVGMYPNTDCAVIDDNAFYDKITKGYDIVYNPLETKFMKLCKEASAESFHGLKMLLYQGIIAYEYWSGKSISDDDALKVYAKMLESMGKT
ncbi:MAG: shikimate dehydrogenase [Lachnospiraceae bacterium]|nr:shikimate dehydrogenase [Lachnospiraceae bacterium]